MGQQGKSQPSSQPPVGTKFFQQARDGEQWSVWQVEMTSGGLRPTKAVERTTYEMARLEVGRRTIDAQMESLR